MTDEWGRRLKARLRYFLYLLRKKLGAEIKTFDLRVLRGEGDFVVAKNRVPFCKMLLKRFKLGEVVGKSHGFNFDGSGKVAPVPIQQPLRE